MTTVPAWFRTVAAVAVLWNLFGVVIYLISVGVFGDPNAGLNDAERAASAAIPWWIVAAFGIGTLTGLVGSLGLLLRKAWALPVLIISLIALLILESWSVFLSVNAEMFGLAVPIMVTVGTMLIAWVTIHARGRGWLG